jgi:hypothetical protein
VLALFPRLDRPERARKVEIWAAKLACDPESRSGGEGRPGHRSPVRRPAGGQSRVLDGYLCAFQRGADPLHIQGGGARLAGDRMAGRGGRHLVPDPGEEIGRHAPQPDDGIALARGRLPDLVSRGHHIGWQGIAALLSFPVPAGGGCRGPGLASTYPLPDPGGGTLPRCGIPRRHELGRIPAQDRAPQSVRAEISFLPPIPSKGLRRRELAGAAEAAIRKEFGPASNGVDAAPGNAPGNTARPPA